MSPELIYRVADWNHDNTGIRSIRRQVFIEEQQVPEEMEWDDEDVSATHFLALLDNTPVATARLQADAKLGRMAVLKHYRNRGIGSGLLHFILKYYNNSGIQHNLYLHAQRYAIPFYQQAGFVAEGETFYEAEIAHKLMKLV